MSKKQEYEEKIMLSEQEVQQLKQRYKMEKSLTFKLLVLFWQVLWWIFIAGVVGALIKFAIWSWNWIK